VIHGLIGIHAAADASEMVAPQKLFSETEAVGVGARLISQSSYLEQICPGEQSSLLEHGLSQFTVPVTVEMQ